jgi:hypothetical protein
LLATPGCAVKDNSAVFGESVGVASNSPRAPESAHQQWGGSPHRTEHWLSVAEGNCVAERRGGEQPEANDQSIIKKMMNSIRPDALANTRGSEVKPRTEADPERESGNSATWPAASTVSVGQGCMGWVEIEWSEVGAT